MNDEEEQTPSEKIDQRIKFYSPLKVFFFLAVAATFVLFAIILMLSFAESRSQTKRIEQQTKLLVDCTTPKGKCYQDSNKRQSGAIQLIGEQSARAAAAATVCAKVPGNDTFEEVYACTIKEMRTNE